MKVHRDISYTNILLREPGNDSDEGRVTRKHFMQHLGLSEIEELRKRLNCRERLLIDFDYGAALAREQTASDEGKKNREGKQKEGSQISDSVRPKPSGARTVS